MADKELSTITDASTPLDGTEKYYIVQSGNTREAAGLDILKPTLSAADQASVRSALSAALKGHIFGLTVSNSSADSDTDHDLGLAAGEAASDDANPVLMALGSAIYKKMDATFAEGTGNGGMVSGESLPTSGTIHIWLIGKADGTTDVCANNHATSGLSPTLPSGFVYKRRIASLRTDASANIILFSQRGDEFLLNVSEEITPVVNPGTSAVSRTLAVPAGLQFMADLSVILANSAGGVAAAAWISPLDISDQAVSETGPADVEAVFTSTGIGGGSRIASARRLVRTNDMSQVRSKLSSTDGTTTLRIRTHGWHDLRGRLG